MQRRAEAPTADDLDRLEIQATAAERLFPGPWCVVYDEPAVRIFEIGSGLGATVRVRPQVRDRCSDLVASARIGAPELAHFIAAADPDTVRALVRRVRELEARPSALRRALAALRGLVHPPRPGCAPAATTTRGGTAP